MDEIVARMKEDGERKRLLLHACCAPCSTYCLELLTQFFDVTVFFYNPNITESDEYARRLEEEKRLIAYFNARLVDGADMAHDDANNGGGANVDGAGMADDDAKTGDIAYAAIGNVAPIRILESRYDPERFFDISKGYEDAPEGGERCRRCFTLRLNEAARVAAGYNPLVSTGACFDYFTTTLTISPLKNADLLNQIGAEAGATYGVPFLPSDFKKKNGFLRSTELTKELHLYRQDYCGCVYSKATRSCAACALCG